MALMLLALMSVGMAQPCWKRTEWPLDASPGPVVLCLLYVLAEYVKLRNN